MMVSEGNKICFLFLFVCLFFLGLIFNETGRMEKISRERPKTTRKNCIYQCTRLTIYTVSVDHLLFLGGTF